MDTVAENGAFSGPIPACFRQRVTKPGRRAMVPKEPLLRRFCAGGTRVLRDRCLCTMELPASIREDVFVNDSET